jgi:hypothetical protein
LRLLAAGHDCTAAPAVSPVAAAEIRAAIASTTTNIGATVAIAVARECLRVERRALRLRLSLDLGRLIAPALPVAAPAAVAPAAAIGRAFDAGRLLRLLGRLRLGIRLALLGTFHAAIVASRILR